MAKTPTPRSYAQILGSMIAAFVAKTRVKGLKVGGPILNILETAAQSDTRATQETFSLLAATSLENAEGTALERHAREEGTRRFGATFTTGVVIIGDSRYEKVAANLYPGSPAPIVGSSVLYITTNTGFPLNGGHIYIGRGTSNYEGPLAYTSITGSSAPFAVNLAAGNYTKKFHNTFESVVLAQGGDRAIPAGTRVQTPQGNASDAVTFSTLYPYSIVDGEMQVENVAVVCTKPGSIGRIVAGAINSFASAPFTGATVTNPAPFTNGRDIETERELKDRIRKLRQSRARGTDLALQQAVTGITARDENKQVLSASVVSRIGFPTTVYIDDGTGYEESSVGVAIESLTDSAAGGETDFAISSRPVAKAFVKSTLSAPYAIAPGMELAVYVGGVLSRHAFSADQFASISNASGYDVAAAINANASLLFGARTADSGKHVILFAKSDTNESIQVTTSDVDSNLIFGFPLAAVQTLRLFKNDVLLNKDGTQAIVYSNPRYKWRTMNGAVGETLTIAVDGTAAQTYTFTDADFIAAKTGYTRLGIRNTLASWVAVFNNKIPGVTASTDQTGLILTSNAGATGRASLHITGGTLVSKGMFAATLMPVVGADNDYTMNRNTGHIRLIKPLAAGDRLTAGTVSTRAFVESPPIRTPINLASTGKMWVLVDSAATSVPTGVTGSSAVTINRSGSLTTITAANGAFANVALGDWVILWDSAFNAANRGAWRVSRIDATNKAYVVVDSSVMVNQVGVALTSAGITVVRTDALVQTISIPSNASYTATSLAVAINANLKGATAGVSRTNRLRLTTNTLGSNGDVAVVAVDSVASAIPLPVGTFAKSNVAQLGFSESSGSVYGTPTFFVGTTGSHAGQSISLTAGFKFNYGCSLVGLRRLPSGGNTSFGTMKGWFAPIDSNSGTTFTVGNPPPTEFLNERMYAASPLAVGPQDSLNIVVDGDDIAKSFAPTMYRRCSTSGAYGNTITLKDKDNGGATLAAAWGVAPGFNFKDFALFMKPRAQSHLEDATKTVLWRHSRFGYDGVNASVVYGYPTVANASVAVTTDPYTTRNMDVIVKLASGSKRALPNLKATTKIGTFCTGRTGNEPYAHYLITGLRISKLERSAGDVVTATIAYPDPAMNLDPNPLGLQIGDYVWVAPASTGHSFDGNAGYRQVIAVSTGTAPYTFSFNDGLTGVDTTGNGTTDNIGSVYFDVSPANWAGVNANDVVSFLDTTNVTLKNPVRVTSVDPNFLWIKVVAQVGPASATIVWGDVSDVNGFAVYPVTSMSVNAIATAVNAIPNGVLSGVATGAGTGTVSRATWDEKSDLTYKWPLVDGVNYVKTTSPAATLADDYSFDLKIPVNANLASGNNDWVNEEVRLVPVTPTTVAAYLNSPAVGGLFGNAGIQVSSQNSKVQIATTTVGSSGSVAIFGGTANSAVCSMVGSPGVTGDNLASYVFVRTAESGGFYGESFVELQNSVAHIKPVSAKLSSIEVTESDAVFTFDANIRTTNPISDLAWQFEKHGDYMAVVWDGSGDAPVFGAFVAGDYVTFSGAGLASSNSGSFQIAAISDVQNTIWVKNMKCVEQIVAATVELASANSVMVGDKLVIGSEVWGASNLGSYTITAVGDNSFTIPAAGISPIAGPIDSTPLNQIVAAQPSILVKKIRSVTVHPTEPKLTVLVFDDAANYTLVSANYGTVVKALDKLGFVTSVFTGADGYARSIGLIAEASKVLYSDPRDTDTYPGYVASGSNISVSGPIIKRMSLSLAVRLRGGTPAASIFSAVKSAVASVINTSKLGQQIPISDIINAASGVNGVLAVSMISPTYNHGNDMIPIQPYEKPMVMNVDSDIQVTIAGS